MEDNNKKNARSNEVISSLLTKIQSKDGLKHIEDFLDSCFEGHMDENAIMNILFELIKEIKKDEKINDTTKINLISMVISAINKSSAKNNIVKNSYPNFYGRILTPIIKQHPVELIKIMTLHSLAKGKSLNTKSALLAIIGSNKDPEFIRWVISTFLNDCLSFNYDLKKKEALIIDVLFGVINARSQLLYPIIRSSLDLYSFPNGDEMKNNIIKVIILRFLLYIEISKNLNQEQKQQLNYNMIDVITGIYCKHGSNKNIARRMTLELIQSISQSVLLNLEQKQNLAFESLANLVSIYKNSGRCGDVVLTVMAEFLRMVNQNEELAIEKKRDLAFQIVNKFSEFCCGSRYTNSGDATLVQEVIPYLVRKNRLLAADIIEGFSSIYITSHKEKIQNIFIETMSRIVYQNSASNAFLVDNSIAFDLTNVVFHMFNRFISLGIRDNKLKKCSEFYSLLFLNQYLQEVLFCMPTKEANYKSQRYDVSERQIATLFGHGSFNEMEISFLVNKWKEYFSEKIQDGIVDGKNLFQILPYIFESCLKNGKIEDLFNLLKEKKFNDFYFVDTDYERGVCQLERLKKKCEKYHCACVIYEKNMSGFKVHIIDGHRDVVIENKLAISQQFTANPEGGASYLDAGIALKVILDNYLSKENKGDLKEVLRYLKTNVGGKMRIELKMEKEAEKLFKEFGLMLDSSNEYQQSQTVNTQLPENQAADPFEMLNENRTWQQLQNIADQQFGRSEQQVMENPENANQTTLEVQDDMNLQPLQNSLIEQLMLQQQQFTTVSEIQNQQFIEPLTQFMHAIKALNVNGDIQATQNIQDAVIDQTVNCVPVNQQPFTQVSLCEQQNVQTLLPEQQNDNVVQNENEAMQLVEVQQENEFSQPLPKSPNLQLIETRALLTKTKSKINQLAVSLRLNEKKLNEAKRVEKFGIIDEYKAIYEENIKELEKELGVLEEKRFKLEKRLKDIRSPKKTSQRHKWSDKQARNGSFDSNNEHSNSESSIGM